MALFNIRWPGSGSRNGSSARDDDKRGARQRRASSTESVDALRRRARHRLIGAAVLLVAGVVGFPLLFDTQPRPISVDIPIAIPGQDPLPPMVVPAPAAAPAVAAAPTPAPAAPSASASSSASAPVTAAKPATSRASTADSLDRGEEVVASVPAKVEKPAAPVAAPAQPKPQAKPVEPAHDTHREVAASPKPAPAAASTPAPASAHVDDDSARARALLEGKPMPAAAPASTAAPAAAAAGRFVVQVGAFGDAAKAQEARNKLTRSGLATYVQSVDTKDGKRIRVRVGPFASKADADRAAAKVKGLDLPASILNL